MDAAVGCAFVVIVAIFGALTAAFDALVVTTAEQSIDACVNSTAISVVTVNWFGHTSVVGFAMRLGACVAVLTDFIFRDTLPGLCDTLPQLTWVGAIVFGGTIARGVVATLVLGIAQILCTRISVVTDARIVLTLSCKCIARADRAPIVIVAILVDHNASTCR